MKRKASAVIKAVITILLFYLLFRKADWREFYATLAGARIGVLLSSFALLWIGHYICIFRWRMLMRPLMPVFSLVRLFEIYCIGLFFNLTFPTAVGGDLVKMYYAGKPTRQYAQSFAATFLDRDSGMFAMMILACLGSLLLPMSLPGIPVSLIVWVSFAAFVALNVMIFTPVLHRILTAMLRKMRLTGIATRVDAISDALVIMGKHPRILFQSLLISLANQLLVFMVTWVTAIALRINVSFLYFLVFVPVITLISMIPISLNGTGLREYAFRSLFSAIGVAPASALALGFLSSIMLLLSAVPGGIVYLFFRNRDDLRQMAALETEFS
jgi:uncharacterized protein (TIRG00374 family)